MIIRPAEPDDGAAIAAIANPIVRNTVITFTTQAKSAKSVTDLIATGQPHWVAVRAQSVIGYATYFPFRNGPGYAHTKEHTIGLLPESWGKGAGRALMDALETYAAMQGVHSMFAGVSAENEAGVAFHMACGYVEAARLRQVGWKFERWHDLVLMQKFLSDRSPAG